MKKEFKINDSLFYVDESESHKSSYAEIGIYFCKITGITYDIPDEGEYLDSPDIYKYIIVFNNGKSIYSAYSYSLFKTFKSAKKYSYECIQKRINDRNETK